MANLKSAKMKIIIIVLFLLLTAGIAGAFIFFRGESCFLKKLAGCQDGFEDGTYRGTFADTDSIQVALEFKLIDGIVAEAKFRHLRRDENYFIGTEKKPYRLVIAQYQELLDYLVGKNLSKYLNDLYYPENIIQTSVDSYTSATVRSSKIISAIRDALNRGIYSY